MSAFFIWSPCIMPGDPKTIEFIVTNSAVAYGIARDQEFIEHLLRDIGLITNVSNWSIKPYRSNYFSEYLDEDDWRGIWQIVWKIRVTTTKKIRTSSKLKKPWIDSNATGKDWWDGPDESAALGCLVICDFMSEAELQKAKAKITDDIILQQMRSQYSVDKPQYSRSKYLGKYEQLQIDLGQFTREFYSKGADYAMRTLELCKKAGATIHYEDRL